MSRKTLLVLAMILTAGLAWAKPELGPDGKPLPPHLRHKQPQKQQSVNLRQQPGRPQMPGRPAGLDAKKPEISRSLRTKPAKAANALPKESIKAVIKDDFLVNDDVDGVGYYAGYQYEPRVAALPSGEMMVVWYDERSSWYYQVFGRCYDASGNPVGEDFLVNQFTGTYAEYPSVTACGNGFLVTWNDYRNGNDYDIYARRFDAAGSPIGGDFLVNDDASGYDQYYSCAAANDSGFIITWEDSRNGSYYDIYAQRYDASGLPIGGNFLVNDEAGSCDHYLYGGGNISASDNGFVITWYDYRSGSSWDVYAQRYNNSGDTLGGNFLVNESGTGNDHYDPCVAANDSGFVVTWYDYRGGNADIYAQIFNAEGDTLGGNFLVNDDGGSNGQYESRVAANDSGFVITWYDYRYDGSYSDIYAQLYKANGDTVGGNFIVNDDAQGVRDHNWPSVAASDSGYVIVWYDNRVNNYGYDIFCQRYGSTGSPLGTNFVVNNDTGTADQWDASVAMDKNGNSVVVWYDMRNDDGNWNYEDIYGQRYDPSGNPVGGNFLVNDTTTAIHYGDYATAAFLPGGGFIVTWTDWRNSWSSDIYAQLFDSAGAPVGGNFIVNDDGAGSHDQYYSDVAASDSGFMITWYDYRNSNWDIYAQRYDQAGSPIGGNFMVNDGSSDQYNPRIASNGSGYVVTWGDYRNGNGDIYAQRFDVNGDTLGGNFLVDDGGNYQYDPSVAMGDSGFVVAWYDYRYDGSYSDIYAQLFKLNGDTIGGNFIVNDDPQGVTYHYYPSVAMSPDGHNVVIAWEDYRNDPNGYIAEIMAQKYVDGIPENGNVVVNGTTLANRYFWGGKRVACTDQRILFNWDDNRRMKGGDIYAKLTDWDLQHIKDAIPPYIVSTSPVNGATGVALNEPVVIAFSEPMDTLSIDGYAIPTDDYNLSWNATGDTMTLTPGTPYNYSTTYSVIVVSGTDTSGNNLVTLPDTFITFTTISNQAPVIEMVSQPVSTFDSTGPFVVKARIYDLAKVGISADSLYYTYDNITWSSVGGAQIGATDTFEFTINGPFTPSTIVNYYLWAIDDGGGETTYPSLAGLEDMTFTVLYPYAPSGLGATDGQNGTVPLSWSAPIATLYYDNSNPWYISSWTAGSITTTRMTPEYQGCKIEQLFSMWYDNPSLDSLTVHIYADDGGVPDEATELVAPFKIYPVAYPSWTVVNVSSLNIHPTGDFHVGYELKTTGMPYGLTDDQNQAPYRSLVKNGGTWYLRQRHWMSRAVVSYSAYSKKTSTGSDLSKLGQLTVLKDADQKLPKAKVLSAMPEVGALAAAKNIGEYQIFRSAVSGGPYTFLNGTNDLTYDDNSVINDSTYYYVVRSTYPWATHADTFSAWSNEVTATPTGVEGQPGTMAYSFYLMPASPNPVSNSAEFRFGLAKDARASLGIYNVLGQRVKTLVNGQMAAGNHTVKWNGSDDNGRKVSSGVYVYQLIAGGKTFTRRFTVIR